MSSERVAVSGACVRRQFSGRRQTALLTLGIIRPSIRSRDAGRNRVSDGTDPASSKCTHVALTSVGSVVSTAETRSYRSSTFRLEEVFGSC